MSTLRCRRVVEVKMPVWVRRGPMLVNRSALDRDDPDHPDNWFAANFPGEDPRDFGFGRPIKETQP